MKRCTVCITPDTRPGSKFNEQGICQACLNHAIAENINWDRQFKLLSDLADCYRGKKYPCDCIIPVSGGKDSFYQVYVMKELLGMNPLLVRVGDSFGMSKAAKRNLETIQSAFGCNLLEWKPDPLKYRAMVRRFFEDEGNFPFVDYMIYSIPLYLANELNIRLVVFGEDPAYEYGTSKFHSVPWDVVTYKEALLGNLPFSVAPRIMVNPDIKATYLSHYMPWDGSHHYAMARRYGFQHLDKDEVRDSSIEQYDQVDALGWQVSNYLKFLKFGFGRGTDIASRWIRSGRVTREEGLEMATKVDGVLDQNILNDFLAFTGMDAKKFFDICDKWVNRDLFELSRDKVWTWKYE